MITLTFTPSQAEWVDWALEGMNGGSYINAQNKSYEEDISVEEAQTHITYFNTLFSGWNLKLRALKVPTPINKHVIADLFYYLEESAPSVSETDATSNQQAAARTRSALSAANLLRNSIPEAKDLRPLGI